MLTDTQILKFPQVDEKGEGARPYPVLILSGPTASGKSALAQELVDFFEQHSTFEGSCILNADSQQVYQELSISTAKPSLEERARVPHALFDICSIYDSFSVVDYVQLAQKCLQELKAEKRLPIVCGGSGLYIENLLLNESYPSLPHASAIREKLQERLHFEGLDALVCELLEKDPNIRGKMDLKNPRRVLRALELLDAHILPSERQPKTDIDRRWLWFMLILNPDVDTLDSRIRKRIDNMFQADILAEARALLQAQKSGALDAHRPALAGIGCKELFPYLRGEESLDEAKERLFRATRRYAKRQRTWFNRYRRYTRLPILEIRDLADLTRLGGLERLMSPLADMLRKNPEGPQIKI